MAQSNYRVEIEDFAQRHYIKKFQKLYKEKWISTERAIIAICLRIDNMLLYKRADVISVVGSKKLVKLDFAIEGSHVSPKSSGNRCILYIDEELRLVKILLIYSKNEISSPNETLKWKQMIKDEYSYKYISKIFRL